MHTCCVLPLTLRLRGVQPVRRFRRRRQAHALLGRLEPSWPRASTDVCDRRRRRSTTIRDAACAARLKFLIASAGGSEIMPLGPGRGSAGTCGSYRGFNPGSPGPPTRNTLVLSIVLIAPRPCSCMRMPFWRFQLRTLFLPFVEMLLNLAPNYYKPIIYAVRVFLKKFDGSAVPSFENLEKKN